MSRGLRKLIIGGFAGADIARDREQKRADAEAERNRRTRDRVLQIVGKNPEAFPDANTPEQPELPKIIAPRTADESAPPRPLPLVGEKSAPLATRAQDPVTTEHVAPEVAGILKAATRRPNPIETMTEGEASSRVINYRQQKKADHDALNRKAFEGLGLAGVYDPDNNYIDDFTKKATHDANVSALLKHYKAQGMSDADAQDMAETGGKMIAERRREGADKRAEGREVRADQREGRVAGIAIDNHANSVRDRQTKQLRASITGNAEMWAAKGATAEQIQAGIGRHWPQFPPGEAAGIAARAIGKKKGAPASSGTSIVDEFGGDDGDGSDTESSSEDAKETPAAAKAAPTGKAPANAPAAAKPDLRGMYDAAAAQLRKEKKSPQEIQRILGKRP